LHRILFSVAVAALFLYRIKAVIVLYFIGFLLGLVLISVAIYESEGESVEGNQPNGRNPWLNGAGEAAKRLDEGEG